MKEAFREIAIDQIIRDPEQPRRRFDTDELQGLAESIRYCGVIEPLVVRPGGSAGSYVLVAGERRWRAAAMARLERVPCVIRDSGRAGPAEVALAENVQRSPLTPIEEAMAYQRLIEGQGRTQSDLARAIGKSQSEIAHRLRLLTLPEQIQELIDRGRLGPGHGKVLLSAPESARLAVGRRAEERNWSVRRLEREVRRLKKVTGAGLLADSAPRSDAPVSAEVLDLERHVAERVGLPVTIRFAASGKGRVSFDCNSLDELDGLLERLGVRQDW